MSDNPSNPSNSSNSNPGFNPSNPSTSDPSDPSRSTSASASASASNTQDASNASSSDTSESITSRIQSSASNLARSALTSTPSDITALGSSAGNKGSSRQAAGQTYYTQTGSSSSSGSNLGTSSTSGPAPGLSFRSGQEQAQDGATHDGEFDGAYDFGNQIGQGQGQGQDTTGLQWTETGSGIDKGKGKETDTFERVWSTQQQYHQQGQQQQYQPSYTHVQSDGSDVLNLLTSPNFNADFPDVEAENDQLPDLSDYANDTASTGLSPSELQTLESFRRAQPELQGQSQTKITSTSLIPDIDDFLSTMPAQSTATAETQLRDAVLTGLSGSEDWVSVEERYHDEVWGFLKPVLQAAQKEIETKEQEQDGNPGEEGEDGPAVARLKMILRHMRD